MRGRDIDTEREIQRAREGGERYNAREIRGGGGGGRDTEREIQ